MTDTTHLQTLITMLAHERERLAQSETIFEQSLRRVFVSQLMREIAREEDFLGMVNNGPDLSLNELAAELSQLNEEA